MGSSHCLLPSYLNKQAKWKNKLYFFTSGTKLPLVWKVHMLPLLCLVVWIRCLPSFCKATCVATVRKHPDCFNRPRTLFYRDKQNKALTLVMTLVTFDPSSHISVNSKATGTYANDLARKLE